MSELGECKHHEWEIQLGMGTGRSCGAMNRTPARPAIRNADRWEQRGLQGTKMSSVLGIVWK